MNIGETYKHRYSPSLKCTIEAITHRGAKVKQTETRPGRKDKVITAYCYDIEFSEDKGHWQVMTPQLELDIPVTKVFTPAHRPEQQPINQTALNF